MRTTHSNFYRASFCNPSASARIENARQKPSMKDMMQNCTDIDADTFQDEYLYLLLRERKAAREQEPSMKDMMQNCTDIDADTFQDEYLYLLLRERKAAREQEPSQAGIIEV